MTKATNQNKTNYRRVYTVVIWHAFFLALTMSMLDLNTVLPSLISELTESKILFGVMYSVMLGAPMIFNLVFSHYLKTCRYKKKFLMLGIYLRSLSFLGMAVFTYLFGLKNPIMTINSFFFWVFIFSISGGFAGIAYADIIAKTVAGKKRTELFAIKQFFSSIAAFLGGLVITKIFNISGMGFPVNYSITLSIGFVGLSIASLGYYFIKEPPSEKLPIGKESFKDYLKKVPQFLKNDINFRRYILIINLESFGAMIMPFYMVFARDTFSISSSYIGKYLIFQVIGTIFSNLVWGYLARKFDSRVIVRACIFIGALIPLVSIGLSMIGPDYYAIVFLLAGFAVSGKAISFEPYLLDIAPDEHRTEYLGIRGTLNIFVIVLPVLGGLFISTFGYYFTFSVVSIVLLTAGIILKK
jgi:MFS family permease